MSLPGLEGGITDNGALWLVVSGATGDVNRNMELKILVHTAVSRYTIASIV